MPGKVIFSNRAFLSIMTETASRINTETGGVFLGHRDGDIWYVIEVIAPGPDSIFNTAYFEYDLKYTNYTINKISNLYFEQLDLIGLWHRHPGAMDSFSTTDDGTNMKYAQLDTQGAVSAIVNLDPDFRLTMYSVTVAYGRVKYKNCRYEVGDKYIPQKFLALKTSSQYMTIINKYSRDSNSPSPNESVRVRNNGPSNALHAGTGSFEKALHNFSQDRKNNRYRINSKSTPIIDDDYYESILEDIEEDLFFLTNRGLDWTLTKNESGALELYVTEQEGSSESGRTRISLQFCLYATSHIIKSEKLATAFCFNEKLYKYEKNLFQRVFKGYGDNLQGR